MQRLLISGMDGRMGQEVLRLAAEHGFEAKCFAPGMAGDLIVDFSHPARLEALLVSPLPLVIGTTGYTEEQLRRIREAAKARPIFQAANFSPGMYVLEQLGALARRMLPEAQLMLIECHHAAKKDAPSGTALRLAERLGLPVEAINVLRGGTVRGVHELVFLGQEEHITLTHTAESRAVFARGALQAARWLMDQPPGYYTMADWMDG